MAILHFGLSHPYGGEVHLESSALEQMTSVLPVLHAYVAHGGHDVPGVGAAASGSTHVVTPMPVHWYAAVPHLPPGQLVPGAGDASVHVVASTPLHVTLQRRR